MFFFKMLIKVQLYFKNWTCKNYTYAPKKKKKSNSILLVPEIESLNISN